MLAVGTALVLAALITGCSDDDDALRGGDPFEPIEGAPRLAVLAPPRVPPVAKGAVRVVASGRVTSRQLVPVIVRNGLDKPVRFPVVTGRSRAPGGKAVTGESQLMVADRLAPGAVSVGYVYFRTAPAPDAPISFSVRQGDAPPTEAATVDLPIEGLARSGGTVTGTVRNTAPRPAGLLSVTVVCSAADGRLLDARTVPPERSVLRAGEATTFTADLDGGCVGVIAGAQGSSSQIATSADLDAPAQGGTSGSTTPTLGPVLPSPATAPTTAPPPADGTTTTTTAPAAGGATTTAPGATLAP